MNKRILVYVDNMSVGEVADDLVEIQSESDTKHESNQDGDDEVSKEQQTNTKRTSKSDCSIQELFYATLEVRTLISESKGVDSEWPPNSHDLTLARATKSIPVKLYNFLAWSLGFSCEPIEDEMVNICPSEKTKVVSIEQDLINAELSRKKQTHKSLALGMTVWQYLKYLNTLCPFPSLLATSAGDLVKTAKSKLLHVTEDEAQDASVELPAVEDKAYILDAMAVLQTLTFIPLTFGELATNLLAKIVNAAIFSKCKNVDFVCDRYPRQSVKNLEKRRAMSGIQMIRIYSEQQKVSRQWKKVMVDLLIKDEKFMFSGEHKEELMKFIFNCWSKDPQLLKGIQVFLTHKENCHRLLESNGEMMCSEIEELYCDHEEADMRMIAHATHASQAYPTTIIKSPDTDVFLTLTSCLKLVSELEDGLSHSQRSGIAFEINRVAH